MNASPVSSQRCTSRREGIALVLAVLLLVVAFSFAAFVIDVGYILLSRNQLQTAADAAAYAGADALATGGDLEQAFLAAKEMSEENSPDMGNVLQNADISFGDWDVDTRTFNENNVAPTVIRVVVRRADTNDNPLPLFFAPIIGQDTANISATAIAAIPKSTGGPQFRFLLDDEMFDTDISDIEDLADRLNVSTDDLLSDNDDDGFLDIPAGERLELPTGQEGDEGMFDISTFENAFPFTKDSDYTMIDFLADGTALQDELDTQPLQDVEWNSSNAPHFELVGKKVLDPVPGTDPVDRHADILALADDETVYLSPVFKSDVSMAETDPSKYGAPAANMQGERRGLVAFKIVSARNNPDGGSYLPLVTIELVDPSTINLDDVTLDGSGGGQGQSEPVKLVQ